MDKGTLTIVDEIDGKILAYRNKASIELYPASKEVGFSEFSYSWEEIITIGKKLEELLKKDLANVA